MILDSNCEQLIGLQYNVGQYALYCGSYNPLHDGHLKVSNYIKAHFGLKTLFEITKENCDKGTIEESDVKNRLKQFTDINEDCVITNTPLFINKYALVTAINIPNTNDLRHNIVIGSDTLNRLLTPKYYGYDTHFIRRAINTFNASCRFLVFPRFIGEKIVKPKLLTDETVIIVNDFIPVEISSTEIRKLKDYK